YHGAAALFMARQHAAQHHEICAAAESLRHIARHGATAITDDLAAQTMRSIRTLNNRRQLRIADTGIHASGTNGAWTNTHFDDICAGKEQLFTHFAGHHVAGDNSLSWPGFTGFADELHEVFGVTIRHINANKV